MSLPESAPALRVTGPADFICAVPYLLGFHPSESVVVVGLGGGEVVVTIRASLEDLAVATPLVDTIPAMMRGGADEFYGFVFDERAIPEPGDDLLPWGGVASDLMVAVRRAGGFLSDVLLVADGRYWSYLCNFGTCCPAEGRLVDERRSSVAAAATYAGMVALPDRSAVERLLDARPDAERELLREPLAEETAAFRRASHEGSGDQFDRSLKRWIFKLVRQIEAGHEPLPENPLVLARLGAGLRRIEIRDAVWRAMDDGRLPDDRLWRYLAQQLPSPYDAAPLFLVGWHSWRRGNGALARIAADRALGSDAAYSAADLLLAALEGAVDPRQMPRLRGRRREPS